MRKYIYILLSIYLAIQISPNTYAQENKQLYELLKNTVKGIDETRSYIKLGEYYDSLFYEEKSIQYYSEVDESKFPTKEAKLTYLFEKAILYKKRGSPIQSNKIIKRMLTLSNKMLPKYDLNSYIVLALNYTNLQKIDSAAFYFSEAYVISKKNPEYESLTLTLLNNIDYLCGDLNEAQNPNCKWLSEEMKEALANLNTLRNYSLSINKAFTLIKEHKHIEAEALLQQLLDHTKENNQVQSIPEILNFMAMNNLVQGESIEAQLLLDESIVLSKQNNDFRSLANSYQIAAKIAQLREDFQSAEDYQLLKDKALKDHESQQLIREKKEQERRQRINLEERRILDLINKQVLIEANQERLRLENEKKIQDLNLAEARIERLKKEQELISANAIAAQLEKDKINQLFLIEKEKAQKLNLSRELTQTQEENKLRKLDLEKSEAELALAEAAKKNRERIFIYSLISGSIIFLGLLGFIIFARTKNKKLKQQKQDIEKQNDVIIQTYDLLEKSNKKISMSINAARYIQQSMLPEHELFEKYFANYYLMYRPKDVVSGDFYWAEEYDNEIFYAAIDCTGHGIPGAFVSMIGGAILNKVFSMNEHISLADALNKAHDEIWNQLKQEDGKNKDGMDLAICALKKMDNDKFRLRYCGARRNLVYHEAGQEEFTVIKATRRGIGGKQNPKYQFEEHTITLHSGDKMFIYSDGLPDQFSPEGKKIMEKSIKRCLDAQVGKTLEEQGDAVQQFFDDHKKDARQLDDIIFFGVEV